MEIPQPENNFKRVFWHEIGHYIAHYYNEKLYGAYGVERVNIIFHARFNDFSGGVTPKKPENYVVGEKGLRNPCNFITTIVYGCVFQSLYTGTSFQTLFDEKQPHPNGKDDMNFFKSKIDSIYSFKVKEIILQTVYDHVNSISKEPYFQELFPKNFGELIFQKSENKYEIDLMNLNEYLDGLIKSHQENYVKFYEGIRGIVG